MSELKRTAHVVTPASSATPAARLHIVAKKEARSEEARVLIIDGRSTASRRQVDGRCLPTPYTVPYALLLGPLEKPAEPTPNHGKRGGHQNRHTPETASRTAKQPFWRDLN